MNNEIENIYRDLLNFLKANNKKYPDFKMDGFAALKGDKYNGELMVVGRAVNGWWEAIDFNKSADDLIERMFSKPRGKCPLSWVIDNWGLNIKDKKGEKIYNSARSAFWRTIKGVVTNSNLDIVPNGNNWPSHIAWSNLYKISRHEWGNPPWWLCQMQLEHCVKILIEEIKVFEPKRILFLTGRDWAEPFINRMNFEKDNPPFPNSKYIEASGPIHLDGLRDSPRVVIAPHPQGKPEKVIIENVLKCFN